MFIWLFDSISSVWVSFFLIYKLCYILIKSQFSNYLFIHHINSNLLIILISPKIKVKWSFIFNHHQLEKSIEKFSLSKSVNNNDHDHFPPIAPSHKKFRLVNLAEQTRTNIRMVFLFFRIQASSARREEKSL